MTNWSWPSLRKNECDIKWYDLSDIIMFYIWQKDIWQDAYLCSVSFTLHLALFPPRWALLASLYIALHTAHDWCSHFGRNFWPGPWFAGSPTASGQEHYKCSAGKLHKEDVSSFPSFMLQFWTEYEQPTHIWTAVSCLQCTYVHVYSEVCSTVFNGT